jgi:uncharacterized SAM-dependent methyltransferase
MAANDLGELARAVRVGLLRRPRTLPVRWLLDGAGAALFEAWVQLPECGMTRAELRLLDRHAQRIADAVPDATTVVELGPTCGARKLRLLEALTRRRAITYTAVEVSGAMMRRSLDALGEVPGVHASALEGSPTQGLRTALEARTGSALVVWLANGAGMRDPAALEQALAAIRAELSPGDAVLLGTDLVEHDAVLLRAYDDPAGVAAALTRTYLARIDRELAGELDVRRFRHEARWDAAARRVELHLIATEPIHAKVDAAGITVTMDAGESIWVASAYKLRPDEPAALAARTGFASASQWIDPTWPYAATLLVAR